MIRLLSLRPISSVLVVMPVVPKLFMVVDGVFSLLCIGSGLQDWMYSL